MRLAQPVGNLINHRAEGPSVRFIIVWKSSELYREPRRAGFLFMVGPNRNIARGGENFSAHLDRVFRISPWKLTSRSVHSFRLLLSYLSLPRKLGKSNGGEGRGGGRFGVLLYREFELKRRQILEGNYPGHSFHSLTNVSK